MVLDNKNPADPFTSAGRKKFMEITIGSKIKWYSQPWRVRATHAHRGRRAPRVPRARRGGRGRGSCGPSWLTVAGIEEIIN